MQTDHDEEKILIEEDCHPVSGHLMESKTSHLDDVLNEKLRKPFISRLFKSLFTTLQKSPQNTLLSTSPMQPLVSPLSASYSFR